MAPSLSSVKGSGAAKRLRSMRGASSRRDTTLRQQTGSATAAATDAENAAPRDEVESGARARIAAAQRRCMRGSCPREAQRPRARRRLCGAKATRAAAHAEDLAHRARGGGARRGAGEVRYEPRGEVRFRGGGDCGAQGGDGCSGVGASRSVGGRDARYKRLARCLRGAASEPVETPTRAAYDDVGCNFGAYRRAGEARCSVRDVQGEAHRRGEGRCGARAATATAGALSTAGESSAPSVTERGARCPVHGHQLSGEIASRFPPHT